jgi:hypothetical protein
VQGVHNLVPDSDLAPGNILKARDHAQGGCLATSRWPEQAKELAIPNFKINVLDCLNLFVAFTLVVYFPNVAYVYGSHSDLPPE